MLIGLSVLLLLYAFYTLYVLRRGTRASAAMTWLSLALVIGFWTWQLLRT